MLVNLLLELKLVMVSPSDIVAALDKCYILAPFLAATPPLPRLE
jgi:hypothetical protein